MKKRLIYFILVFFILVSACNKDENKFERIGITERPLVEEFWEGEELNLEGLSISLSWEDGNYKKITLSEFASNNIITVPAHGEKLEAGTTTYEIIHSPSGVSTVQELKVWDKAIELEKVEKVCETPFDDPASCIIKNDTLFVITEKSGLYAYDFLANNWNLIDADISGSNYYSKQGFIKDNKWYIPSFTGYSGGLSIYDFETGISSTAYGMGGFFYTSGALYADNTLYLFNLSDYGDNGKNMYTYDFNEEKAVKISNNHGIEGGYNSYVRFRNNVEINNEFYILLGSANNYPWLYKFNKLTEQFEEQTVDPFAPLSSDGTSSVNFSYKDYVIYGLGNYGTYKYFAYINTITNKGGYVFNDFYEQRSLALSFEYNGAIYLLGGTGTTDEGEVVHRTTIEKLIFSEM